jgi:hypothetical protein
MRIIQTNDRGFLNVKQVEDIPMRAPREDFCAAEIHWKAAKIMGGLK